MGAARRSVRAGLLLDRLRAGGNRAVARSGIFRRLVALACNGYFMGHAFCASLLPARIFGCFARVVRGLFALSSGPANSSQKLGALPSFISAFRVEPLEFGGNAVLVRDKILVAPACGASRADCHIRARRAENASTPEPNHCHLHYSGGLASDDALMQRWGERRPTLLVLKHRKGGSWKIKMESRTGSPSTEK
jgi:hypothetical protein